MRRNVWTGRGKMWGRAELRTGLYLGITVRSRGLMLLLCYELRLLRLPLLFDYKEFRLRTRHYDKKNLTRAHPNHLL